MSTLNCYEEFQLAEKLIEINRWADMVKFTRGGGEAMSIAARIARAASGKENIAFCGYLVGTIGMFLAILEKIL